MNRPQPGLIWRYASPKAYPPPALDYRILVEEMTIGPDHPDVAQSCHYLTNLYQYRGRYADAEPLYNRALAIYEKALGPESPNVATSLENRAALLRDTGRSAEANEMEARTETTRAKHAEEIQPV